jgi:hypothetical protein
MRQGSGCGTMRAWKDEVAERKRRQRGRGGGEEEERRGEGGGNEEAGPTGELLSPPEGRRR